MSTRAVRIGDMVRFRIGAKVLTGQVREDRGSLGVGGRRLDQVVYQLGKDNWYQTELPADEMELIKEPAQRRRQARPSSATTPPFT
jgi:hypothetical protein